MKTTKPEPANCLECEECINMDPKHTEFACRAKVRLVGNGQGIPEWCPRRKDATEDREA